MLYCKPDRALEIVTTLSVTVTSESEYKTVFTTPIPFLICIWPEVGSTRFSSAVMTRSASKETPVASSSGLKLTMEGTSISISSVVMTQSESLDIPAKAFPKRSSIPLPSMLK